MTSPAEGAGPVRRRRAGAIVGILTGVLMAVALVVGIARRDEIRFRLLVLRYEGVSIPSLATTSG